MWWKKSWLFIPNNHFYISGSIFLICNLKSGSISDRFQCLFFSCNNMSKKRKTFVYKDMWIKREQDASTIYHQPSCSQLLNISWWKKKKEQKKKKTLSFCHRPPTTGFMDHQLGTTALTQKLKLVWHVTETPKEHPYLPWAVSTLWRSSRPGYLPPLNSRSQVSLF